MLEQLIQDKLWVQAPQQWMMQDTNNMSIMQEIQNIKPMFDQSPVEEQIQFLRTLLG